MTPRLDYLLHIHEHIQDNIDVYEWELARKRSSPFYHIGRFFTRCKLWILRS